jgi:hypothetical protein
MNNDFLILRPLSFMKIKLILVSKPLRICPIRKGIKKTCHQVPLDHKTKLLVTLKNLSHLDLSLLRWKRATSAV